MGKQPYAFCSVYNPINISTTNCINDNEFKFKPNWTIHIVKWNKWNSKVTDDAQKMFFEVSAEWCSRRKTVNGRYAATKLDCHLESWKHLKIFLWATSPETQLIDDKNLDHSHNKISWELSRRNLCRTFQKICIVITLIYQTYSKLKPQPFTSHILVIKATIRLNSSFSATLRLSILILDLYRSS